MLSLQQYYQMEASGDFETITWLKCLDLKKIWESKSNYITDFNNINRSLTQIEKGGIDMSMIYLLSIDEMLFYLKK